MVSSYLKSMGSKKARDIDYIKTIATRAAKVDEFNKIPAERLKSLYNAFNQRIKDVEAAIQIESSIINDSGDGSNKVYN